MFQVHGAPSIIRLKVKKKEKKDHEDIYEKDKKKKSQQQKRCKSSESIPLRNTSLTAAQCDTDAQRVCGVYPCTLTPRAEYLALTLCKPIGGVGDAHHTD